MCVRRGQGSGWTPTPVILHMCGGDREAGSAQDDPFPSPVSQGPRGPGGVRSLPTERAARLVRRDCWGEQGGGFLLHGLQEGRREGGSSYPILLPRPPTAGTGLLPSGLGLVVAPAWQLRVPGSGAGHMARCVCGQPVCGIGAPHPTPDSAQTGPRREGDRRSGLEETGW